MKLVLKAKKSKSSLLCKISTSSARPEALIFFLEASTLIEAGKHSLTHTFRKFNTLLTLVNAGYFFVEITQGGGGNH